jgi:hypothetical protein
MYAFDVFGLGLDHFLAKIAQEEIFGLCSASLSGATWSR